MRTPGGNDCTSALAGGETSAAQRSAGQSRKVRATRATPLKAKSAIESMFGRMGCLDLGRNAGRT